MDTNFFPFYSYMHCPSAYINNYMRVEPPLPREKVDLSSANGLCIHTKNEGNPGIFVQRNFIFIVYFEMKVRHIRDVYQLNKTKTMSRMESLATKITSY